VNLPLVIGYFAPRKRQPLECLCVEHGYVPLDSAEIVRRTVEEARRIYWPEWGGRVRA
jgi:hypothetical protein